MTQGSHRRFHKKNATHPANNTKTSPTSGDATSSSTSHTEAPEDVYTENATRAQIPTQKEEGMFPIQALDDNSQHQSAATLDDNSQRQNAATLDDNSQRQIIARQLSMIIASTGNSRCAATLDDNSQRQNAATLDDNYQRQDAVTLDDNDQRQNAVTLDDNDRRQNAVALDNNTSERGSHTQPARVAQGSTNQRRQPRQSSRSDSREMIQTRQAYRDSLDVLQQYNDYTTDMPPHMSKNLQHNVDIRKNLLETWNKFEKIIVTFQSLLIDHDRFKELEQLNRDYELIQLEVTETKSHLDRKIRIITAKDKVAGSYHTPVQIQDTDQNEWLQCDYIPTPTRRQQYRNPTPGDEVVSQLTSNLQDLTITENQKQGFGRRKSWIGDNNNRRGNWTSHPANTTPARDDSLGVLPRRVNFYDDSTVHSSHPLHLNSTSLDDPYISPNFIPLGDKRGRSLGSASSPSSSDLYQDLQAGHRAPHNKDYPGSEPRRTHPPESNSYRTYQEQQRATKNDMRTPPGRVPQPQQQNRQEPRTLDAHQRDMQRRGERAAPLDLRYKELPPPWNIDIQCYDQSEMSDLMQIRKNYANLKFDGKVENYSVWRSRFIICIHRRYYADEEKCIILEEMLVDNASKAKQRIPPGWYGYKQTIENLERLFGSRLDDVSRLMALLDARSIPDNNAPLLRKLLDDLQELRYMFWELNRLHSFDDITLYTKVLRCLPTRYRIDFEERMIMEGYQDDDRSTSSLVGWLENKYKVLQRVPAPTYNPKQRYTASQSLDEEMDIANNVQSAQAERKPPTCSLCQLQHYYPECKQFLQMHPDQRLNLIRKKKLCARCLSPNHISATCKAEIICQQCGRRHHPLLHGSRWRRTDATLVSQDFLDSEIPEPPDSSNSLDENNIPQLDGCNDLVLTTGKADSPSTSLRFAAVKLHQPVNESNQIICNVVLDDGASFNCLDTEVAAKLQLDDPKTTIAVKGFGDTKSHFDSITTNVVLTSLDDNETTADDVKPPCPQLSFVNRLSTWNSLLGDKRLQGGRLLQYVYDPPLQTALPLFTDTELRDAETSLIRMAQAPFGADISRIEKRKQPESVALRKCSPFLGDGTLRVGSRLLQSGVLLPRPTKFITDKGSKFVGLTKQFNTLFSPSDFSQTQYLGITWQFNLPMTPHSGGIFEHMVQTLKKCLVRELNATTLDDPQPLQATMRSEFIINSRPITPVNTDSGDLEALTPNHFLLGKVNGPLAPMPDGWPLSKTREHIQSVSDKLWIRFQKELRPQLHKMPKWWRETNPFYPGQLFMVLDINPLKTSWTRGRIIEVFQGPDQLQRTVTVKTSSGAYKTAVHLLAPLLSEENLPQEAKKDSPLA